MLESGDASTMVTEGTSTSSCAGASSMVWPFSPTDAIVEMVTEGLGERVRVTGDVSATESSNKFDEDAPSL